LFAVLRLGVSCVSNSEGVSSSHNHTAISLLQSVEKPFSKAYTQHHNRITNVVSGNSNEGFKSALENLGAKYQNDEKIPSILSNMDHLRSFYNTHDHNGWLRSNYSSLEVLCQIFPGRSRTSLESLLKVGLL
jgi:hypothetical protein